MGTTLATRSIMAIIVTLVSGTHLRAHTDSCALIRDMVVQKLEDAYDLVNNRSFQTAWSVLEETQGIVFRVCDSFSDLSARIHAGCGYYFMQEDKWKEARTRYAIALETIRKQVEKDVAFYAECLHRQAIVFRRLGYYEEAESHFLESFQLRDSLWGPEHPECIRSLNSLAILYTQTSRLEMAEQTLQRVRHLLEGTPDPDSVEYAQVLNNLANVYNQLGRFHLVEDLYQKAIAIWKAVYGTDHASYASGLNNLGLFYAHAGQYRKAESLYLETLAIRERMLGKRHSSYAQILNNLGNIYRDMNDPHKAESHYRESIAIWASVYGKEHPDYSRGIYMLGKLFLITGQTEQAAPLLAEALQIREKTYGPDHVATAQVLHSMGTLHEASGKPEEAAQNYQRAMNIRRQVYGAAHPDFVKAQFDYATVRLQQGEVDEADSLFRQCVLTDMDRLESAASYLSEEELAGYTRRFTARARRILAYAAGHGGVQGLPLTDLAMDQILFLKGFLLHTTGQIRARAERIPGGNTLLENLRIAHRERARLLSRSGSNNDSLTMIRLDQQMREWEIDLARLVENTAQPKGRIRWEDIRQHLTKEEMLVEFVDYPVPGTDSVMYGALLLRKEDELPVFVPLFEEKELASLQRISGSRQSDFVNELYAWPARGLVSLGGNRRSMYEMIWKPLENFGLTGIRSIYFSATGVLHRLNPGAIAMDEETVLADRYRFVCVSHSRNLVREKTGNARADGIRNSALLVGDADFDAGMAPQAETNELSVNSRTSTSDWSPLVWTGREVERIENTLKDAGYTATVLTGKQATEEHVKQTGQSGRPSPGVLHLATHGFFFPDPEQIAHTSIEEDPVFKRSDNPMIRSGLILAGGNYAWRNGHAPSPDMEDGILTAYEISQMDLSHTELVVLSACETGLGDIEGNEGVYGLQRAFKIAGAKYLIMSLWKVPDRETMEFMTTFYKNWLLSDTGDQAGKKEKMTIPDAFRKTQREMRDRFYNPYAWGAFVLLE